ncbi:hypothetical protein ACFCV8_17425 [Streptomyces sp. NPDC056347]|uniref:hypothetical protein n=1 Tax=Streptomyces sp. NPDC056347 TaxID=3345790 RepID=UPI0035DDB1EB
MAVQGGENAEVCAAEMVRKVAEGGPIACWPLRWCAAVLLFGSKPSGPIRASSERFLSTVVVGTYALSGTSDVIGWHPPMG